MNVRLVLDAQVTAWNRGDLEAFCAFYASDALFVSATEVARGDVLPRYLAAYPDRAAMGTLALDILDLRHAPGVASAVLAWSLDAGRKSGGALVVFHERAEGWRIVQDATWVSPQPG